MIQVYTIRSYSNSCGIVFICLGYQRSLRLHLIPQPFTGPHSSYTVCVLFGSLLHMLGKIQLVIPATVSLLRTRAPDPDTANECHDSKHNTDNQSNMSIGLGPSIAGLPVRLADWLWRLMLPQAALSSVLCSVKH